MKIRLDEIMDESLKIVSDSLKRTIEKEKEHISINDIKDLRSPDILQSKYGRTYVESLVFSAIEAYHQQLREKLLEKGIDIGEMGL